ncbi:MULTISPECIES: ATP-binding protein [unclassified Streptomyces]|uniref:ATP-binding protein n=1 Tax=unclassified Streptomyces TaxID=2593676 RepID=UPI00164F15D0|nr:ATP-binding protein [Streptomyces sp. NBC_01212]WSQ79652.1 ATP-binding protein [Streptomyces sp. NBC_01213]WSQ87032.1 ATP-binding protein [Streptomyces sp. NBC_01212]
MPTPHSQPASDVRVFAQRFSATRRGARLARLLSALQLIEWGHPRGTDVHDSATIVVAELAANAALHGCVLGRDFALLLTYDTHRSVVRIEVSDTHPAQPTLVAPTPDADHGRGLVIVDALATSWGVRERVGPGKTVWAECAFSTRPSSGPSCL